MPARDGDARRKGLEGWRILAAILIYPMTVAAGLGAVLRIVSACCVAVDTWSVGAAAGNLALGVPILGALAALWITTACPAGQFAWDRGRFLLVATGLITGLILESLLLLAGLSAGSPRFRHPGFLDLWTFAGPPAVGLVNLGLLIQSRERAFGPRPPSPPPHDRPVPAAAPSHSGEVLRPFALRPYRRERADTSVPLE